MAKGTHQKLLIQRVMPQVLALTMAAGFTFQVQASQAPAPEGATQCEEVELSPSPAAAKAPLVIAAPAYGAKAELPTLEAVMQDAQLHAIIAIQRYVAGDFSSVEFELDKALEVLLGAELPEGRAGLLQLQDSLPEGYAEYDLVSLYTEALKANAATEEVKTNPDEWVKQGPGVGGPQGVGEPLPLALDDDEITEKLIELEPLDDSAWIAQEIERIASAFGESQINEHETFQREVERFIQYYQGPKRGFFDRSLARSMKYMPMVESILAEKGVPPEMAYIAFVESGFRPRATSRAAARGLWQFMPRTARAYGLQVDKKADQRVDPYLSTIAAREYFLDLVAIFGSRSFLLAMASYNAGEGRVQGCLKRLDDPFTQRTFWHIAPCLRVETQEYIPRIIAAAIIAQSPERFGFKPYGSIGTDDFDVLEMYQPTSVAQLARWAGITVKELRKFNPDLASSDTTTPRDMESYRLVLPGGQGEVVLRELLNKAAKDKKTGPTPAAKVIVLSGETLPDELMEEVLVAQAPRAEEAPLRAPPVKKAVTASVKSKKTAKKTSPKSNSKVDTKALERTKFIRYAAQAGNTTERIAADFGKSVSKLLTWNPYLEGREMKKGDIVHIYELDYAYERHVAKVNAGDTLSEIAEVYGVSSSKIARWNGIERHMIYVGQDLVIYSNGPNAKTTEPVEHRFTYTVKSGNNLSRLSGYFGVGIDDIKAWNDLNTTTLRAGQKLDIKTDEPVKIISHKVKSGESLGTISQKYNVKISFLADTNGLRRNSGIRVGQGLIVYVP